MKHSHFQLGLVVLLSFLAACSPTPSQVEKALEKDPDILVRIIEKNPKKFIDAFQKAAQQAEQDHQLQSEKEEKERLEREAKNPLQPVVSEDRAIKGDKSAPIVIVAYSDFQCPYCHRGFQTIEEIFKAYPGKVRYLHKHLPLPMHPMAEPAAKRYEAIALQNKSKAIQFHDLVFKGLNSLNQEGEKFLDAMAKKVGADLARMKKEMNSNSVLDRIQQDMAEAEKFGIQGTPGYIVNGISFRGAYPFESFKQVIDRKLAQP